MGESEPRIEEEKPPTDPESIIKTLTHAYLQEEGVPSSPEKQKQRHQDLNAAIEEYLNTGNIRPTLENAREILLALRKIEILVQEARGQNPKELLLRYYGGENEEE